MCSGFRRGIYGACQAGELGPCWQDEFAVWTQHFNHMLPRTPEDNDADQLQHIQDMESATGGVPLFAKLFLRPPALPADQDWPWESAWDAYRRHPLVSTLVTELCEFTTRVPSYARDAHCEVLRSLVLGVYTVHAGMLEFSRPLLCIWRSFVPGTLIVSRSEPLCY